MAHRHTLSDLLRSGDPAFFPTLRGALSQARGFAELTALATLYRRAAALPGCGPTDPDRPVPLRLALLSGYSPHPLAELVTAALFGAGFDPQLFVGEYDNYVAEILDADSPLYAFAPSAVLLLPAAHRCRYAGSLLDPREQQLAQVQQCADQLLDLCRVVQERSGGDVLLCNYPLPPGLDPGPLRSRSLGSDWSFRKAVNLELGLSAPPTMTLCDLEQHSARRGLLSSHDARGFFQSKQPGAPDFLADVAMEVAHLCALLRRGPKKVLVLDLDNTLWGGVIGDDGLSGIELGDTSPRGEAFKAFQRAILSLKERGVLLGVCSKNDHERAAEAFLRHPEMVLRLEDIVSFKANWEPKPDNLRLMAAELGLSLDSFVFIDDNPAEIDIVRRFTPEVTALLLPEDPSGYADLLRDCRLFEVRAITSEDRARTVQYQKEAQRQVLLSTATDMDSYLRSLEMEATIRPLCPEDLQRTAQLVNKSNQFNLTTRRRSEAEVAQLLTSAAHAGFTVRLRDRFGDHGLIAVVITEMRETTMEIDTWLMSCRVLKRQVEDVTTNEIVRMALARGAVRVRGRYCKTAKNGMVRDLLPRMGFSSTGQRGEEELEFCLDSRFFTPRPTHICIHRRADEPA